MKRISTTVRVVLCLVCLTISSLLVARAFGIISDPRNIVMAERAKLCESIAINFSLLVMKDDAKTLEAGLKAIASRNSDIRSIGVRQSAGQLKLEVGGHRALWSPPADGKSTETHMFVPIAAGNQPWGTVEVLFESVSSPGLAGWLEDPLVRLIAYMTCVGSCGYYFFLKRVLRQLDPSKVVPNRVRSALDTLTEGLLILDDKQRIVLANEAFTRHIGRTAQSLLGQYMSDLPWRNKDDTSSRQADESPWRDAYDSKEPKTGVLLDLEVSHDIRRTFVVNAAPVFNDKNRCQGVLTSLEDVTPLEQKKKELHYALEQLRTTSEEIRHQNLELERLATTDPLTECLNRRSYFSQFESHWKQSERHGIPLACLMVDIDFFKSINDTHGHAMGDEVLKGIAATLRNTVRLGDLVCRFGGEEFSVLLPHTDINEAAVTAERLRVAIEATVFPGLKVTASIGVSARELGAADPQGMLDQADKCLYVAKRNGRNQVVRFDAVPKDLVVDESKISRTKPTATEHAAAEPTESIPYRAVNALLGALACRHRPTAEHCRRVADLCVIAAESQMKLRECYLLEMAALLHDIGKVGIPDAVLLKRGQLSMQEWDMMRQHESIGAEILSASFGDPGLVAIVENRQAFFAGNPQKPHLPKGDDIPIGARILAVADAFDSMTHESVYRTARSQAEAFAELRNCAGSQFDPQVVERFIQAVADRHSGLCEPAEIRVNRDVACDIGSQIERLVNAIDQQDMDRMKVLAGRLKSTASGHGLAVLTERAAALEASVDNSSDAVGVLESAYELIELCRSTQRGYLSSMSEKSPLKVN